MYCADDILANVQFLELLAADEVPPASALDKLPAPEVEALAEGTEDAGYEANYDHATESAAERVWAMDDVAVQLEDQENQQGRSNVPPPAAAAKPAPLPQQKKAKRFKVF